MTTSTPFTPCSASEDTAMAALSSALKRRPLRLLLTTAIRSEPKIAAAREAMSRCPLVNGSKVPG